MYKEALWFYIIVGLFALGFDMNVIYHAPMVTKAYNALRLTFMGKSCTRILLIYITYQAQKAPEDTPLGWQYWLALVGAIFAVAGMLWWTVELRAMPYGRRHGDVNLGRRRDDGQ